MARDRRIALFVFVTALLLRLVYLYESAGSPFFSRPVLDAMYLDNAALQLAAGNELSDDASFRAPLYTMLLGAVYSIDSGDSRFFLVKLLQHIMGALTCVFIYMLARDAVDLRAGIAAGLLAAFYPPLIFYEGEVLIVTLFIFLNALALCLFSAGARRRSMLYLALGGFALALSVITRPNIMLFVPAVFLWALIAFRSERPARRIATAGVAVLPVALVLAAMCTWNYARTGSFVLVSSQGGINFYIGNGAEATGMPPPTTKTYGAVEKYRDNVEVSSRKVVEHAAQAPLSPEKLSDFWYGLAMQDIKSGKAAWLKLMFKKTVLFWNNYEVKNNRNLYFARRYSVLLRVIPLSFGVIAVLGLFGIGVAVRSGFQGTVGLMGFYTLAFMASIVMFFVCARLRLPVTVGLLPAAGVAASHLVSTARRSPGRLAPYGVVIGVLAIFVFVDWYGVKSSDHSAEFWLEGKAYFELARYDDALESFKASVAHDPAFAGSRLYLGNCYLQSGAIAEAEKAYASVLEIDKGNARALNGLGACAERSGDKTAAAAYYGQAVAASPSFAKPRTNLGMVLLKTGRLEAGRELLVAALSLDDGDPETYLGLALHGRLSGDEEACARNLEAAAARGGEEYRRFFEEALLEAGRTLSE